VRFVLDGAGVRRCGFSRGVVAYNRHIRPNRHSRIRPMSRRLVVPEPEEVDREIKVTHPWWTFQVRYNVRRGESVPVVRMHDGASEGVMLRWGFPTRTLEGAVIQGTPLVSRDAMGRFPDAEAAWQEGKRAVVPLAGFYVWQLNLKGIRQPHYVRLVGRPVFGAAALWQRTVSDDAKDDVIESCALLTLASNSLLLEIDSGSAEMLAILGREDYGIWLSGSPEEALSVLRAYPAERMLAHPVPPYVNHPGFDGPPLIHAIR
jgi:putative SOS response-associated peptidase YedK